jgi:hypothetical protein
LLGSDWRREAGLVVIGLLGRGGNQRRERALGLLACGCLLCSELLCLVKRKSEIGGEKGEELGGLPAGLIVRERNTGGGSLSSC